MGLVRESRRVVRLVQELIRGWRGRASVSEKIKEVAMKTASGCRIGARISGTCQKLPVPANMELGDPGALGVGRGVGW